MKKSPSKKLTPTVDRPDLFKHAKSLVRRKKVVKAWAVFDISKRLGRYKEYIDITNQGTSLGIYSSKLEAEENHRNFNGKTIVPVTITYTI